MGMFLASGESMGFWGFELLIFLQLFIHLLFCQIFKVEAISYFFDQWNA
jgi:hypothetical protein